MSEMAAAEQIDDGLSKELALYDDLLIPVCAVQEDQTIAYFNSQFLTFTKLSPRKVRAKAITDVLNTALLQQGDYIQRCFRDMIPLVSGETSIDIGGGEIRDAIFKLVPHVSAAGFRYLVVSIQDISIERTLHAKHRIQLDELKAKNEEIKKYSESLEILVEQRTQELRVAMAQSERLLLNILPAKVAARLKAKDGTIADRFPSVSVLFADIVSFTTISGGMDPVNVVEFLSQVFDSFDKLCIQHGVEKIKTIGDAYLAVAGVPTEDPKHAIAICNLALAMRESLDAVNAKLSIDLRCRWGIASGPVVAGVLGTSKFAYDIWGDTVNVASRMESHGAESKIQIAANTYEMVKDRFTCEKRGTIEVKGKGSMHAYWLTGRK